MKNLLIKGNKTLAVVTGILLGGAILNGISKEIPISHVEANGSGDIASLSISTSKQIEETIVVKKYVANESSQYTPDAKKVENIRKYLAGRNAPLADYAQEFVKAADHYGIDYRIVAAISVIESNGGRHTFKAYNAWGWSKTSFENWTDGIWTVSAGISKYYSNGLTRPELIAPYYCPPNAVKWAQNVNYVMNQIGD
jgi:hypothetical protein